MLDPEYVKRIDAEMQESGGQLAPDEHEAVWANLKSCDEWGAGRAPGSGLEVGAYFDEGASALPGMICELATLDAFTDT